MNVYLISGLGADGTVFQKLAFGQGIKVHYLDWIPPKTMEPLRDYALRMAESIDQSSSYIIVGLSFGGMLATEMASILQPQKTILISSISSITELPWHFRLVGKMRVNRLLPAFRPHIGYRFITSIFGVESQEEASYFRELLKRSDPNFSKWAVDAILQWDRTERPSGVVRIHGGKDRVLPIGQRKVDYLIKDGGHFMIFNRADEISRILSEIGID